MAAGLLPATALRSQEKPSQPVRERVSVDLIRISVDARDGSGAVRDLSAGDLTLRVDGRPVPIDSLERAASAESPREIAPGPASTPAAASRPAVSLLTTTDTLIFVDDTTNDWIGRREAIDELVRFLDAPSRFRGVAVAVLRRGGVVFECPWTPEPARAAAVLRELRRRPPDYRDSFKRGGRVDVAELELFRRKLMVGLLEGITLFPDRPGRRELILVTGGSTLAAPELIPNLSDGTRGLAGGFSGGLDGPTSLPDIEKARSNFDLWSRSIGGAGATGFAEVAVKALERDVVLIPIDTKIERPLSDLEKKLLRDTRSRPVISSELEAARALKTLGETTGGDLIAHPRSAGRRLADFDGRDEWVLTFRDPFGDHGTHRVALTCVRSGVRLRYRKGYRIADEDDRVLDAVVSRLRGPSDGVPSMALRATAFRRDSEKGIRLTRLTVTFAPPVATGEGRAERPVDLFLIGRAADGTWTLPIRRLETARWSEAGEFTVTLDLRSSSEDFAWSVGLRDRATGLVDCTAVPPSAP